jgi:hypothetical protein
MGLNMRVVILGAGNILLSDEGLGVHAIERLPLAYSLPAAVEIIDGGTCGMEMLEALEDLDALIMVDAIRAGQPPGTPIRLLATPCRCSSRPSCRHTRSAFAMCWRPWNCSAKHRNTRPFSASSHVRWRWEWNSARKSKTSSRPLRMLRMVLGR